jgi:methyl-accepting chemotaxis protein
VTLIIKGHIVSGISSWWIGLGLRLKLQILIQGFLIVILVIAQLVISVKLEDQVLQAAEERARTVADGAINGLNTLMITKAGQKEVISDPKSRLNFIDKMGKSESIKEMRVFRAKQLDDEFPEALPQELPADEMDRRVLETGKAEFSTFIGSNGDSSLRAVVPFIAKKNFRSINCLDCHGVDEDFVLGGASVTIDIEKEVAVVRKINLWIWVGQGILQILLFLVISVIVGRLVRQLGGEPVYVIDIVRQIAKGNLSGEVRTAPNDTNSLLYATKHMQGSLKEIVAGIIRNADQLTLAARQLSSSSDEVLKASERQSDSSASVAASVEEMTVCIGQISENSADAQRHASETGDLARNGAAMVQEVISEMDKISGVVTTSSGVITSLGEQSNQIHQIVNVIKEIADQTNLLALNAAIEAARAGEQGRGFAVVADEVRKLAERTTQSTQEIAAMIQGIQSGTSDAVRGMSQGIACVDEGVQMVGRAGSSMELIQGGVQSVLASVGDISLALREQNSASNLIASNVQSIAQMTEDTSAIVRSMSASASRLEEMAGQLKASVGRFQL